MRCLVLLALVLAGCGLNHHSSAPDFSPVVGTWDGVCNQIDGTPPPGLTLGQHKSIHCSGSGVVSTTDQNGQPITYQLSGGAGHYTAARDLHNGTTEYLDVTVTGSTGQAHTDVRASPGSPVISGAGWALTRLTTTG